MYDCNLLAIPIFYLFDEGWVIGPVSLFLLLEMLYLQSPLPINDKNLGLMSHSLITSAGYMYMSNTGLLGIQCNLVCLDRTMDWLPCYVRRLFSLVYLLP